MSDIAIRVENLSKKYKIGANQARYQTLRESIMNGISTSLERFKGNQTKEENIIWALKDINFEVKHGEVLGIIGRNGAGKSTLLKILSRITKPTTGRFELNGRVGSLLEVGTGFHPELTGRENIYLSGAILGMKRKEIDHKFDEIVDFAEIEKFLDTPAKHYSSGMYMRLAFSVAAHLEPEILLVDEVLAVGDAEFQKKCLGKMGDVAGEGRTVLFVSHNMGAIRLLCESCIIIQNGENIYHGESGLGINFYNNTTKTHRKIIEHVTRIDSNIKLNYISINQSEADTIIVNPKHSYLEVEIYGKLLIPARIDLEVRIYDYLGIPLAFYSPGHYRGLVNEIPNGDFHLKRKIILPNGINKGTYYLNLLISEPNVYGWIDFDKEIQLITEGYPTTSGQIFEYTKGLGWIFLYNNEEEFLY